MIRETILDTLIHRQAAAVLDCFTNLCLTTVTVEVETELHVQPEAIDECSNYRGFLGFNRDTAFIHRV